jgi:hypothetical protein
MARSDPYGFHQNNYEMQPHGSAFNGFIVVLILLVAAGAAVMIYDRGDNRGVATTPMNDAAPITQSATPPANRVIER